MSYANANIDLVSLIEQKAGVNLVKKANHYRFGDEYWSPCPFCGGGDDRFHVWPGSDRAHYWCRVCGMEGSAPKFLMEYCSYSFGEALMELGLEEEERAPRTIRPLDPGLPPCKEWQTMGKEMAARAESYLWHPKAKEGQRALAYLRSRGLTDETIKAARIGYCPIDRQTGRWFVSPFTHWGIDPETVSEEQRKRGGVLFPPGIVIPWFGEDDILWRITVHRPEAEHKYVQIQGSAEGLYNAGAIQPDRPAMIVESELDALSVQQEAGDLITCVATGGTARGRRGECIGALSFAGFVLQSFDADEAGEEASAYWLKALPNNTMRWSPWGAPRFKDANDMLRFKDEFAMYAGATLRDWVFDGMEAAAVDVLGEGKEEPEPLVSCHQNNTPARVATAVPQVAHAPIADTPVTLDIALTESLPESSERYAESFLRFARTVDELKKIFGDRVKLTAHEPGLTLEQHVKAQRRERSGRMWR